MLPLTHEGFVQFGEVLAWAAGIVVSLGVIGKAIQVALRTLRRAARALDWLEDIHAQLTPDEGTSLRDIIYRMDENDQVAFRNAQTVYAVVLKMHHLDPLDAPLLEAPRTIPKVGSEDGPETVR